MIAIKRNPITVVDVICDDGFVLPAFYLLKRESHGDNLLGGIKNMDSRILVSCFSHVSYLEFR